MSFAECNIINIISECIAYNGGCTVTFMITIIKVTIMMTNVYNNDNSSTFTIIINNNCHFHDNFNSRYLETIISRPKDIVVNTSQYSLVCKL